MRGDNMNENVIEWLTNDDHIAVTFSQKKYVNKVKKFAKEDDRIYLVENDDGSVFARLPIRYLKLNKPRTVSDEQREAARQRLTSARASKS